MFPFLKPNLIYNTDASNIKLDVLKDLDAEGLILDLDNTIMAPKAGKLEPKVQEWLDLMKNNFKVVILTNNKKAFYLESVRLVLDLPVIGFAKKPFLRGVDQAMEILNLPNNKIVVIGDRPLTDIWLAQRYGFKSILVRALTADIEPKWKFYLRKLEWSFINKSMSLEVKT